MLIPVSSHLLPIINECLYIALQTTDDESFAEAIKDTMVQLEELAMGIQNGSVRFVAGHDDLKLH